MQALLSCPTWSWQRVENCLVFFPIFSLSGNRNYKDPVSQRFGNFSQLTKQPVNRRLPSQGLISVLNHLLSWSRCTYMHYCIFTISDSSCDTFTTPAEAEEWQIFWPSFYDREAAVGERTMTWSRDSLTTWAGEAVLLEFPRNAAEQLLPGWIAGQHSATPSSDSYTPFGLPRPWPAEF